jgi:hypothetical protein
VSALAAAFGAAQWVMGVLLAGVTIFKTKNDKTKFKIRTSKVSTIASSCLRAPPPPAP